MDSIVKETGRDFAARPMGAAGDGREMLPPRTGIATTANTGGTTVTVSTQTTGSAQHSELSSAVQRGAAAEGGGPAAVSTVIAGAAAAGGVLGSPSLWVKATACVINSPVRTLRARKIVDSL